jgi:hypothetical protein
MLTLSLLAQAGWAADRMWEVLLKKETAVQKGKTTLRVDVANAVRRLWKVYDDGRIPAWAPGTTGLLGDCLSEDDELRQLIEGVASAGSWAVWMGVFSRSWMKLFVAGGLTYKRARIVTGKTSAVITVGVAVLLRRFVMSGRPRKVQRWRSGDRNNWNRRYVSTMIVMDGRWAAVGNSRLTNLLRVVLHISDATCAGASGYA